jgi:transcriptional regulator with XRE-family HTH domain
MPSPARLAQPVLLRFSRRVRDARVKAGWSQRELAKRAYMGDEFVYRIEKGTENPSLASMALLALALDCDVTDLLASE